MKSIIYVAFLLTIIVNLSFAAVSIGQYKDPKYPGKCAISDKLILSPGDMAKDPNTACGRIICGNDGYAEFQTCGVQKIHGCILGDYINKSLPYPECCKREKICQ